MAFTRSWDESTPTGSEAASDIDLIFRDLQTDIRERVEGVIPGWIDDTEDPKRGVIQVGVIADRPAVADAHTGEYYLSNDETDSDGNTIYILYVFDGTQWVEIAQATSAGDLLTPGEVADNIITLTHEDPSVTTAASGSDEWCHTFPAGINVSGHAVLEGKARIQADGETVDEWYWVGDHSQGVTNSAPGSLLFVRSVQLSANPTDDEKFMMCVNVENTDTAPDDYHVEYSLRVFEL